MIFHSIGLMYWFPQLDNVIDYTRVFKLSAETHNPLLQSSHNLHVINQEILQFKTIISVVMLVAFWVVIVIGELLVKKRHPHLIKDYLRSAAPKFTLICLSAWVVELAFIYSKLVGSQLEPTSSIRVSQLINPEIYLISVGVGTVLPLLCTFLFIRLYLGMMHNQNWNVSRRFSFHDNDGVNYDFELYKLVVQCDINKNRFYPLN